MNIAIRRTWQTLIQQGDTRDRSCNFVSALRAGGYRELGRRCRSHLPHGNADLQAPADVLTMQERVDADRTVDVVLVHSRLLVRERSELWFELEPI